MAGFAEAIVRVARSKISKDDWLYDKQKDNFAAGKNKCNQFVYDVLVEANVAPLPSVPKFLVFGERPPLAGEWADPSVKIKGWKVVAEPKPGDIVAEAHNYADATGHVGIVTGKKLTTSANANFRGKITENDWGFRAENEGKAVFRRFSG